MHIFACFSSNEVTSSLKKYSLNSSNVETTFIFPIIQAWFRKNTNLSHFPKVLCSLIGKYFGSLLNFTVFTFSDSKLKITQSNDNLTLENKFSEHPITIISNQNILSLKFNVKITFKIITPPKTFSLGFFNFSVQDYKAVTQGDTSDNLGCILQFEDDGYMGPWQFEDTSTTSWYLRDLKTNVMLKPRHLQLNDIVSIEYLMHKKLFKWCLNNKLLYEFTLDKSYESANEIYFWFSMFDRYSAPGINAFKYEFMYRKTNEN